MRLNRWHRFGIVLSLLWVIGAALYQRNADVDKAEGFAKYATRVCLDAKFIAHDTDLASCEQERQKNLTDWMEGSWGNVAFIALVPVPLGWLAIFILLNAGRAANIGFRAVVPWTTLSKPKKGFVIFCVLASVGVALLAVIHVLNLYVDTQVPVAPGSRAMVVKTGDDLVTAQGTWTRSGLTEDSTLAYPLQTSHIECNRPEHRCTEARATVSQNLLVSELVEYEVESWSATTIVFKNDSFCTTEVFTIDLKTESVNGTGHSVNNENEFCKKYGAKEQNWNYRLSDGFKVYWAERQKVRPIPLRIIQAFFGN
jgi:hypothetical protein